MINSCPHSGFRLLKLTTLEKLDVAQDSPDVAELWSYDRSCVFRLCVHNYENPEEEWVVADVEFEDQNRFYRIMKWEFDTLSLACASHYLSRLRTAGLLEVAKHSE
jgi:hypothetical protein